jgi:trans-aconitate 3-methyltransferase
MYEDLVMPWDLEKSVEAFPKSSHKRFEWNRNGVLETGEEDFFSESKILSLKELGDGLGTASMVTQWRNANPKATETGNDCVALTMEKIAAALGRENKDHENVCLRAGSATTLLLFKSN